MTLASTTTRLIVSLGVWTVATVQPNALAQEPDQSSDVEADGENVIAYMQSHVEFEYTHANFDGGTGGDTFEFDWQQAFGSPQRFAAGIEVPIVHVSGDTEELSATGMGDVKLQFKGVIWKSEEFENAAGIEITTPSSTRNRIGEGQAVLRLVWGFSAEVTPRTLLSAEPNNKALANQPATPELNSIGPELILTQAFAERFGAYLDWDNYYEFCVDQYVSTMEIGLELALDRKEKWSFAPYIVFPLNYASRLLEFKNAAGARLAYAF